MKTFIFLAGGAKIAAANIIHVDKELTCVLWCMSSRFDFVKYGNHGYSD